MAPPIQYLARFIARRIVDRWKDERGRIASMVEKLPPADLRSYEEAFAQRKKSMQVGYLCWSFGGCHYLYVKRPIKQAVFWGTLGGLFVWYMLDLFLMYFVIDRYNRQCSFEILQEIYTRNSIAQCGDVALSAAEAASLIGAPAVSTTVQPPQPQQPSLFR